MIKSTIITLLTLITAVVTLTTFNPSINITITNNENGFAVIKTKEFPLLKNYYKVLHVINTTQLELSTHVIKETIDELKYISTKGDPMIQFLIEEYESLIHNLKSITPIKRQRRGIMNFVGKFWKYTIGTMDNDDAEEIYAHLNNLDKNSKNVITASNEQGTVNNNLIKAITDIKNHTNNQTIIIRKYLDEVGASVNSIVKAEDTFKRTFQLYISVKKLNGIVEKFLDIILTSKLEILSHDIFNAEEIKKYNMTVETLPYVKTNILFDTEMIIFVLKIPQMYKNKYNEALFVPFPNNDFKELDTDIEKIIVRDNLVYEYNINMIKEKQLQVQKILKFNNTCKYKINKEKTISQISDDILITKNLNVTNITQNCNNKNIYISGNNIIMFHFCRVKIEETEFINENSIHMNTFVIPQTNLNTIKLLNNVTLENIYIKTLENREKTILNLNKIHTIMPPIQLY